MRSETDTGDAARTVEELERFYLAFDQVAYPHDPAPKLTIDVVLFANENAIEDLGHESDALMIQRTGADQEDRFTFVTHGTLDARAGPREYARFLHELAHRFTAFHFPSAPPWLAEGLSELFSTLEIDGNTVVLGKYLPDRVFVNEPWRFTGGRDSRIAIPIAEAPSIARLQGYSQARFYGQNLSDDPHDMRRVQENVLNYSSAWNLVHLLLLGDRDTRERFNVFLEALARGTNTAEDSWKANFGPIATQLERDYRNLLGETTRSVARIPFDATRTGPIATRELSPAEIHLLWASVRRTDVARRRQARLTDIRKAIELEPNLLAARMALVFDLLGADDLDGAMRELTIARRIAPRDPLVLRAELLIAMHENDAAQMDRVGPMLDKRARTAGEYALVSEYLLRRGKNIAAIRAAKAGLEADPGSWRCFAAIGSAHEAREDFASAADYLGMAINMLGEGDSRRVILMKRLAELEARGTR